MSLCNLCPFAISATPPVFGSRKDFKVAKKTKEENESLQSFASLRSAAPSRGPVAGGAAPYGTEVMWMCFKFMMLAQANGFVGHVAEGYRAQGVRYVRSWERPKRKKGGYWVAVCADDPARFELLAGYYGGVRLKPCNAEELLSATDPVVGACVCGGSLRMKYVRGQTGPTRTGIYDCIECDRCGLEAGMLLVSPKSNGPLTHEFRRGVFDTLRAKLGGTETTANHAETERLR